MISILSYHVYQGIKNPIIRLKDTGPMTTPKLIEDLLTRLLALESRFGDLDARCFLPRHKLAHAYRAIGALEQAINLFLKNLDAKSQVLGETHFETINSQSSLANCYYALGQYSMAIQLFSKTFNNRTKTLGSFHPDTLRSIGSLANSYRANGQLAEAKQLHTRVLNLRQLILGANHPRTIVSLKHVENILASMEDS